MKSRILWLDVVDVMLSLGGFVGFRLHSVAGGQDLDAKALLASSPGRQPPVGGHPLDANPILAARP
ncbi:hypothetical protein Taro_012277 [Colocasia esculenta]|uniref:Uncharacterized protein n=1 Tax=Colocasia esculenta TaxID=4460 RepID=A0A843U3K0_COLES|nr:hypothetical protein [Colocasia esculenta]